MIEQEKGLLYLINLNSTSFEQNPGKMNLPKGRYVAEIREGTFSYKMGHAADVEITYQHGSKKRLRFPEFGRFETREVAENVYQGLSVEFEHDGGEVEVYNPRPAKQYFGRVLGECLVGIWDGRMFGSPDGNFESQEYKPVGNNNVLVLTNNPESKPYQSIKGNLTWQSDFKDAGKYNAIVIPPESYSFLHKMRDQNCLDSYLKSGGRAYLVGISPQYLSYYNVLPFDLPWYLGKGQFNMVAASVGDMIIGDGANYIKLSTSLTMPLILGDDGCQIAKLRSSDRTINDQSWCAIKRVECGEGKVVWSSFFLMDYDNTENWNKLILDQMDWLMK